MVGQKLARGGILVMACRTKSMFTTPIYGQSSSLLMEHPFNPMILPKRRNHLLAEAMIQISRPPIATGHGLPGCRANGRDPNPVPAGLRMFQSRR
jgi:hypothetical protein